MLRNLFRKTNDRFNIYLVLSFFYAILIFYLSSLSEMGDQFGILRFFHLENLMTLFGSIEKSDFKFLLYPLYLLYVYPDKVAHLILYAGFGLLLYLTFNNSSISSLRKYSIVFTIIIGISYGASDEFHQSFVPGRTASVLDLLADAIGIIVVPALKLSIVFIKKNLQIGRPE